MSSGGFQLADCVALLSEAANCLVSDGDSVQDEPPPLTWRGDPRLTRSDCIVAIATSEFDSKFYNVHKRVLCGGPCRSNYFAGVFSEESAEQGTIPTAKIALDKQDADNFPIFLDFTYNTSKEDDADVALRRLLGERFKTGQIISLRHMARKLECQCLTTAVNKLIRYDLSLTTCTLYLTQASRYKDDRLIESSERLCIDNFTAIEKRALTRLPPHLFRSIIDAVVDQANSSSDYRSGEDTVLSYHVSDTVCQYFEEHPEDVDVSLLLDLTDKHTIPRIAPEAAIGFTALVRDLSPRDFAPDSDDWRLLVNLCQRCAAAVVQEYGWKDFSVKSALDEYLHGPCADEVDSKMDSLLFATSFAAALEKAQGDVVSIRDGPANVPGPAAENVDKRVRDLETENDGLKSKEQHLRDEVETYKNELEDMKETVLHLKDELKLLRRQSRGSPRSRHGESIHSCSSGYTSHMVGSTSSHMIGSTSSHMIGSTSSERFRPREKQHIV